MSELIPTLKTLIADAEADRPAALCTVVKTRGSTPQTAGAAMLVRADGSTLGTLGGGCVEAEVRTTAFQMLQQNRSGLLDYLLDHDYGWDDGLICGGRMFVGVTPMAAGSSVDPIRDAVAQAERREPTSFPITVEHEGKMQQYRVHLEVPPTLLIAGAGHVGQALACLAVDLDFYVVVIDDRADQASTERFPNGVEIKVGDIAQTLGEYPIDAGCYVVIVTRGHQHDHQALQAIVRRPAGYIGLIGSKRKSKMILRDLADEGVTQEQIDNVRTPIGLSIGAVTVAEIATSIAAELVQVRRANTPKLVEGPFEVMAGGGDAVVSTG
ncbi:MAG: XdhC family protein [Planctomycetes bacterium]|nr:XdhC family protein [Planctomycetota bacterium]